MRNIPGKMPQVDGDGPVAEGFRLAFAKLNEILDYMETARPAPSAESFTGHGISGVTRRPRAKISEPSISESDTEARWA